MWRSPVRSWTRGAAARRTGLAPTPAQTRVSATGIRPPPSRPPFSANILQTPRCRACSRHHQLRPRQAATLRPYWRHPSSSIWQGCRARLPPRHPQLCHSTARTVPSPWRLTIWAVPLLHPRYRRLCHCAINGPKPRRITLKRSLSTAKRGRALRIIYSQGSFVRRARTGLSSPLGHESVCCPISNIEPTLSSQPANRVTPPSEERS